MVHSARAPLLGNLWPPLAQLCGPKRWIAPSPPSLELEASKQQGQWGLKNCGGHLVL